MGGQADLGVDKAHLSDGHGSVEAIQARRALVFTDAGVERLVHFPEIHGLQTVLEGSAEGRGGREVVLAACGIASVLSHVPVPTRKDIPRSGFEVVLNSREVG